MSIELLLLTLIVALNTGACLLDIDYHLIRGGVSQSGRTTLLGVSSWVQYQSRICTMLSIVALTYIFESNSKGLNILEFIGGSYFIAWSCGYVYLKFEKVHRALSWLVLMPTRLVFQNLKITQFGIKKNILLISLMYMVLPCILCLA